MPSLNRPEPTPIVDRDAADEFPELREDLNFLAEKLVPEFVECDLAALREQNRHRRQQLLLVAAGSTGAVLGAVQAAFDDVRWPGLLVALVALLSAVFAQRVQHGRALPRYLDERAKAERLRSIYFQYLVGAKRFTGVGRRQRLRDDVAALLSETSP
ncbi:MAG: DUF4231 domain-containing protein [Kineosporiaceae bacterium]